MHPSEHMEQLIIDRLYPILQKHGIRDGVRKYRAQKNFGDVTIDLQKVNEDVPAQEIEALSDDILTFKKTNKFINVTYGNNYYCTLILDSIDEGSLFTFERKEKRILVEHTSANPTGPLHIGRARNSIIGDTIARILRKYGFEVTTEYYMDDIGTQVEALLLGTEKFKDDNYTEAYRKYFAEIDSHREEVENAMKMAESGNEKFIAESKKRLEVFLYDLLKDLEDLNIFFDGFTWESRFILDGSVKVVLDNLKEHLKDDEGAKYIQRGEDKIYLMRSNGTSLYFTRDIAYHILKSRNYDLSIDVLGEDHKDHFKNLTYILGILGIHSTEAVFYSFVVTKKGKMSTRRGNVVTLRDLISESIELAEDEIRKRRTDLDEKTVGEIARKIGTAAVRYNMIKFAPEKPITFDWDEALNFEGEAAPFIMYSYARASSILKKASGSGTLNKQFLDREAELLKEISRFPEVVKDAAERRRPDRIAKYSYELSSTFNQFYRDCPVIGDIENYQKRVNITKAFKLTMDQIFDLLGIIPSDKI